MALVRVVALASVVSLASVVTRVSAAALVGVVALASVVSAVTRPFLKSKLRLQHDSFPHNYSFQYAF
jgi:hypothetical protein